MKGSGALTCREKKSNTWRNSVQEDVTAEMEKEGASVRWEPFKGSKHEKIDYFDTEKIPIITEAQLRNLHFEFEQEKFHRPDSQGRFVASEAILKHEFRDHFEMKGLVYAGIRDFMIRDDKKYLYDNIENWEPSCATGPWEVVAEAIGKDGSVCHSLALFLRNEYGA